MQIKRKEKDDETTYIENNIYSKTLQEFINTLKDLEQDFDVKKFSLEKSQIKIEECKLQYDTMRCTEYFLTLELSLQNINDKDSEIDNKFDLLFLLGMQETPEIKQNEQVTCAVCLEDVDNKDMLIKLKCGHCFCKMCIRKWFETTINCPVFHYVPKQWFLRKTDITNSNI